MSKATNVVHMDSARFALISDATANTAQALMDSGELSAVEFAAMQGVRDRARDRAASFRRGEFDE